MNDYTARKNLDRLFRALIEDGFATIQGNICCRNCAGHEIANEHEDGTPAAFYTEQDVEDGRGHPDHTNTYIGFGPVNGGDMDETRKVGERIVELADELCVPVEWDGDPAVRILVNPVE